MLLSKIIMIYGPQKSIKEPFVPQLLLQKLTWKQTTDNIDQINKYINTYWMQT